MIGVSERAMGHTGSGSKMLPATEVQDQLPMPLYTGRWFMPGILYVGGAIALATRPFPHYVARLDSRYWHLASCLSFSAWNSLFCNFEIIVVVVPPFPFSCERGLSRLLLRLYAVLWLYYNAVPTLPDGAFREFILILETDRLKSYP